MKKKQKNLNSKEKLIIETIHKYGGAMTPNEIAEKTGISYITVKKYVEKLTQEEILNEIGGESEKKENNHKKRKKQKIQS